MGARQELDRLRAIVSSLPVQCRRVFELRKFEGLSHRDIAQRMGLSEKTVENHLTRALARVAETIAECTHPWQAEKSEPLRRVSKRREDGARPRAGVNAVGTENPLASSVQRATRNSPGSDHSHAEPGTEA